MNSDKNGGPCPLPIDILKDTMTLRWGNKNDAILDTYDMFCSKSQQDDIDRSLDISVDDIKKSLNSMKSDSAAGPDKILVRTLKMTECSSVISLILNIMLKWNIIPEAMRDAKTVFIYKGKGERNQPSNWRPISICSVIRRLIERVLDAKVRQFISLNENQRGFVNQPGSYINISLVNGCLQKAKKDKDDLVVVMLDVTQAFDTIGHDHLDRTLDSQPLPSDLRNLIKNLFKGNSTKIFSSGITSNSIELKKGVFQGSPLSPILFNLSIDFILKELTEKQITDSFGFQVTPELDKLTLCAFADDLVVISNSLAGAHELVMMVISLLQKIGLQINCQKSALINIAQGQLSQQDLYLCDNTSIKAIGPEETIKYLGITFQDEIKFNPDKIIASLRLDLENLISTPMLRPDQKLNIVNQYIWPKLIYPLQLAPLHQLPLNFLEDIDKIIRSSVKEMLFLPADIPNSMLYTSKNFRGLQLIRASWEAFLQHCNVCISLVRANNPYVNIFRQLEAELQSSCDALNLSLPSEVNKYTVKKFRDSLQCREYESWKSMKGRGKGVELYSEVTAANNWILNKKGLSTSEWITCLKMNANVAAVRSIPGRSLDGTRCRYCPEIETLAHVLGHCERGMLLRNSRHHTVRSTLAAALKKKGWTVQEEVSCIAKNGSMRRVDIIAFKADGQGIIVDPTIRFEMGCHQAMEVHKEKQDIYVPTVDYFKTKYKLNDIAVYGLFVGSRGAIPKFFENFRKTFDLPTSLRDDIVLTVLKKSCQILVNHCFT